MNTAIVIPCYNEQERIDADEMIRFSKTPGLATVFVDDGSTDSTATVLADIVRECPQASLVSLRSNVGKGEAVRQGLLSAMTNGATVVGFADADLATPVNELNRLSSVVYRAAADVVLGSRVRLAGRTVERSPRRHYLGRLIATYIVLRTGLPIYDTQCGAKFFRSSKELRTALSTPFATRWLFDVELLRRLQHEHQQSGRPLRLREEPLETWVDVAATHLSGGELLRVARDFARLETQLRRPADDQLVDVLTSSPALREPATDIKRRATA